MRRIMFLIVIFAMAVMGCSSGSKNVGTQPAVTPVSPAATAPAPAQAAVQTSTSDSTKAEWRCVKGADVRIIQVESHTPKGCKVYYPNAKNEIASSVNSEAHCIHVRSRIRGNLENAGFTCSN